MVDETSKVRLAWHAYACIICDAAVFDTTGIAVGFVVSRTCHIRLLCGDWGHLIVEVIQDGLVDFIAFGNGGVREKALNLFLEPGVSIRKVTSWNGQSSHL